MSFSKIAQIALYIVVGISVLVVVFFYFGDSLINVSEYEAKIEKLSAPAGGSEFQFVAPAEIDTAAIETDSAALGEASQEGTEVITPVVEETLPAPKEVEPVNLTFMETLVYNKTDIALVWAYILVILTLLVALAFSVAFMFSNTRSLIRGLLVLVGAAILIGVAYMLGSDTPLSIIGYEGTDNKDPQVLKLVDTGLISMYFILGITVLTILYSEIARYFK